VRPPELAVFRQKLLALKERIVAEGDVEIEPARKEPTDVADEDAAPLTEMSQVIASKRNRARTDVLGRVEAALARIEHTPEDFGQCTECGDTIGRRLEAMPYVELCVECQNDRDGSSPNKGPRRHAGDFR
jgi:DnaK suppressor protein